MDSTCETKVMVRRSAWESDYSDGELCLTLLPGMNWNDTQQIRGYVRRHQQLQRVACDCRHVDITSTAAIGWLVTLYRWCLQQGWDFAVCNPGAESMACYRAQGLDGIVPIAA